MLKKQESENISSLPHYFLTRWNADKHRLSDEFGEEVRKYFKNKNNMSIFFVFNLYYLCHRIET